MQKYTFIGIMVCFLFHTSNIATGTELLSPKSHFVSETNDIQNKLFTSKIQISINQSDIQTLERMMESTLLPEDDFKEELAILFGEFVNNTYILKRIVSIPKQCYRVQTYQQIVTDDLHLAEFIQEITQNTSLMVIGDLHTHHFLKQFWGPTRPKGPSVMDGLEKEFSFLRDDPRFKNKIAPTLCGLVLEPEFNLDEITLDDMENPLSIINRCKKNAYFFIDDEKGKPTMGIPIPLSFFLSSGLQPTQMKSFHLAA